MGPPPRCWHFLHSLTQGLEENPKSTVYDDYEFVTKRHLENVGARISLDQLLTRPLRVDFLWIRLSQGESDGKPFAYEAYRRQERRNVHRAQLNKLPRVHGGLALKLIGEEEEQPNLQGTREPP